MPREPPTGRERDPRDRLLAILAVAIIGLSATLWRLDTSHRDTMDQLRAGTAAARSLRVPVCCFRVPCGLGTADKASSRPVLTLHLRARVAEGDHQLDHHAQHAVLLLDRPGRDVATHPSRGS